MQELRYSERKEALRILNDYNFGNNITRQVKHNLRYGSFYDEMGELANNISKVIAVGFIAYMSLFSLFGITRNDADAFSAIVPSKFEHIVNSFKK